MTSISCNLLFLLSLMLVFGASGAPVTNLSDGDGLNFFPTYVFVDPLQKGCPVAKNFAGSEVFSTNDFLSFFEVKLREQEIREYVIVPCSLDSANDALGHGIVSLLRSIGPEIRPAGKYSFFVGNTKLSFYPDLLSSLIRPFEDSGDEGLKVFAGELYVFLGLTKDSKSSGGRVIILEFNCENSIDGQDKADCILEPLVRASQNRAILFSTGDYGASRKQAYEMISYVQALSKQGYDIQSINNGYPFFSGVLMSGVEIPFSPRKEEGRIELILAYVADKSSERMQQWFYLKEALSYFAVTLLSFTSSQEQAYQLFSAKFLELAMNGFSKESKSGAPSSQQKPGNMDFEMIRMSLAAINELTLPVNNFSQSYCDKLIDNLSVLESAGSEDFIDSFVEHTAKCLSRPECMSLRESDSDDRRAYVATMRLYAKSHGKSRTALCNLFKKRGMMALCK